MKYQFLIVSLFLLNLHASAQQSGLSDTKSNTAKSKTALSEKNALDNATVKCVYLFTKKTGTADPAPRKDTMFLEIGTRISRFYDPARLGRDSMVNAGMKRKPEEIKSVSVYSEDSPKDISKMQGTVGSKQNEGESYQIYKGKTDGKITIVDHPDIMAKSFQYEDETGILPWKITKETDTILTYTCHKATLKFRGRDYIAWFTTDIPLNDGPWKFSGLPGLILKVEDTQQLFSFSLIGLEQLTKPKPILLEESENIKCTKSDFEKQKKKAGGGMLYNFNAGNIIVAKIPVNNSYQPMELE